MKNNNHKHLICRRWVQGVGYVEEFHGGFSRRAPRFPLPLRRIWDLVSALAICGVPATIVVATFAELF